MRNCLKYIIVCLSIINASNSFAQSDTSATLTLDLKSASLSTVVSSIESQTYFHFFYDSASIGSLSFTYNTSPKKITTILTELLIPYGINFYFDNQNNIFLTKSKLLTLQLSDNFFTGKKQAAINTGKDFAFEQEELGPIQEALLDKKL